MNICMIDNDDVTTVPNQQRFEFAMARCESDTKLVIVPNFPSLISEEEWY